MKNIYKHSLWIKTVTVAVMCLFLFNSISWGLPQDYTRINRTITLQVQSTLPEEGFRQLFDIKSILTLLRQKGAINVAYATIELHSFLERHYRVNFPYMFSNDEMLIRFRTPQNPKEQISIRCYDPRTKEPSRAIKMEELDRIPVGDELCIEVLRQRQTERISAYELMIDRYDSYYRVAADPLVAQNIIRSRQNILNTAEATTQQGVAVISDAGRLTDIPLRRLLAMKVKDQSGKNVYKFNKIYLMDLNEEDIRNGLRRFSLTASEKSRIEIKKIDLSLILSGLAASLEREKKKGTKLNLQIVKGLINEYVQDYENWQKLPFDDDSVNLFISSAGITSFYTIFARYLHEEIVEFDGVGKGQEHLDQVKKELMSLSKEISRTFLKEVSRVTAGKAYVAGCVENKLSKGKLIGTEDLRLLMPSEQGNKLEVVDSIRWETKPVTGEIYAFQVLVLAKREAGAAIIPLEDQGRILSDTSFSYVGRSLPLLESKNLEFQKTDIEEKGVVMLVPTDVMNESQKRWKNYFNKLSNKALKKERLHILDVEGVSAAEREQKMIETITSFKAKGYKVVVAVNDERMQSQLIMQHKVEALTFKGGVDLYFILTCLRALHRKRVDLLMQFYVMLTSSEYKGKVPNPDNREEFNEFIRSLIFEMPDAKKMDYDVELEAHNKEIKQFISAA